VPVDVVDQEVPDLLLPSGQHLASLLDERTYVRQRA
jgi:hypothetical protein